MLQRNMGGLLPDTTEKSITCWKKRCISVAFRVFSSVIL